MKIRHFTTSEFLLALLLALSPACTQAGGQQAGHQVVFPLFTISEHITQFRLTNNHPENDVRVELLAICSGESSFGGGGICAKSDRTLTLTHNQTLVRNVETFFSLDPQTCPTGFVLATTLGNPDFDLLSGSTYLRRKSTVNRPNATAGAQAIAIKSNGLIAGGQTLRTDFMATTNAANPDQGRRSLISVVDLDTKAGRRNDGIFVAADWYNQAEVRFSGSFQFICHDLKPLHDISGAFNLQSLGSHMGTLELTAYANARVIGQILEVEPNRTTLRNLSFPSQRVPQ